MPFFGSLGTFGLSKLAVFVPPVVNPLTNSGSNDAFVVKYNSDGIPLWARRLGGTGSDQSFSLSTDSSGNIIVVGNYASNPLNIFAANGTTVSFTLSNSGSNDGFVVKYDSDGTPLWARRIGGTGSDTANSVSTDSSGNVIVAGNYTSDVNIYAANGTTVSFTKSGSNDAFVVKYDSSGTPLWARRISGSSGDQISSVSVDSSGNVIVTGYYFSNPLVIYAADDSTFAFTLSKSGFNDAFVVKYNSSGTPVWARRIGGTNDEYSSSSSTDSSGNVIVTGTYFSSLNIFAANDSTSAFTLANSGVNDGYVVKYDSSGTPLWARRMGGTDNDNPNSVRTDSSGNVIVFVAYNSATLNIFAANGSTVSFSLANSGQNDSVVVKYDSSGTPLWVRRLSGTLTEYGQSISTDSSGNIIVTGYYTSSTMNILAANGTTVSFTLTNTNTNNDSFVVKYDSSGTPLWARRISGTGSDIINSVSTDSSGNIVVAGTYTSTSLSFS
jgi:hypothetical protein